MAQNFWIAIIAWTSCFVVTMVVSMMSQPRAEKELEGLVYGLTKIRHDPDAKWYERPAPLAVCGFDNAHPSEYLVRIT